MSQFRATSFFDVKQTLWECRPCCEKRLTCWWRNSILLGFANDGPTSVSALLCPVKRLCLWHLKKKLKALPLDKEIRTIFFEDIKELVIVGDHMIFFYVFNSPTITTKSPLTVTWAASWMCGWIFFCFNSFSFRETGSLTANWRMFILSFKGGAGRNYHLQDKSLPTTPWQVAAIPLLHISITP